MIILYCIKILKHFSELYLICCIMNKTDKCLLSFSIQMNCYKHFSIKNWATKNPSLPTRLHKVLTHSPPAHGTHQTLVDELRAAEFEH